MPTHKQGTTNAVITERSSGKSATNDLKSMYASSPIHKGEMDPEKIRAVFQDGVLDGKGVHPEDNGDGGHTFGSGQLMQYVDAPNMDDVATGAGGLPASPYVPNPSSPGEGSVDPSAQPAAPDGFGQTPSDTPGVGVGSQLSPQASSAAISGQTLGDYGLGKSSN